MTRTLRVLLVDDNPDHRFLTRRALRSLPEAPHVDLAETASGEEAIARLHGEPPLLVDLVLLDLKMPGKGGLEVLEALRRDRRTAGLVVVVLSSSEQAGDRAQALSAGADDVLVKPIGAAAFQQAVRQAVGRWARARHDTRAP